MKRSCSSRVDALALLVALALIGAAGVASSAEPVVAPAEAPTLLAHTKDMLVRLRVIHKATGARTAAGSGFVATPDGLVLTNYHLVSKIALEPHDHVLELEHADGSRTTPRLVAIDVADDLAVLATGRSDQRFLPIRETWMTAGNRGFAMGYSRGLEPTIVEGTIHYDAGSAWPVRFTGAIDPGMSGGPAVSPDGEVLGVNVARRAGERLVRKLVPSRSAAHLLRRAASVNEPPTDFRKDVAAQVSASLMFHYSSDLDATAVMGHYIVPDTRASYARCSDARPWLRLHTFPRSTRTCQINYDLFVDDDLQTGALLLSHERFEKGSLPTMEFAELMETVFAGGPTRFATPGESRAFTAYRCHEDLIRRPGGMLRVVLCARAYKKFAGLYEFHLRALTVDSSSSALLSTLTLSGVSFKDGQERAKKYLEGISWTN